MVVLKSVRSPHLTTCSVEVLFIKKIISGPDLAVGELPVHIIGDPFLQCYHLAPAQPAQVLTGLTVAAALGQSPGPLP